MKWLDVGYTHRDLLAGQVSNTKAHRGGQPAHHRAARLCRRTTCSPPRKSSASHVLTCKREFGCLGLGCTAEHRERAVRLALAHLLALHLPLRSRAGAVCTCVGAQGLSRQASIDRHCKGGSVGWLLSQQAPSSGVTVHGGSNQPVLRAVVDGSARRPSCLPSPARASGTWVSFGENLTPLTSLYAFQTEGLQFLQRPPPKSLYEPASHPHCG
jgi:hypothetical protein